MLRRSILSIAAILLIIGCIVYTIGNYKTLSSGEGWGIVAMVGLCGVGIVLLLIGIAIQKIFRNNQTAAIIIEIIILIAAAISIFHKSA